MVYSTLMFILFVVIYYRYLTHCVSYRKMFPRGHLMPLCLLQLDQGLSTHLEPTN